MLERTEYSLQTFSGAELRFIADGFIHLPGGAEEKYICPGRIGREKTTFFMKEVLLMEHCDLVGFPRFIMTNAQKWMFVREELMKRGLPVVPDAWIVSEDWIAMPNYGSAGMGIYESKFDWDERRIEDMPKRETDSWLPYIYWDQLHEDYLSLARHAAKEGVQLPEDGPAHLAIYPDGHYEPWVLDLSWIKIWKDPKNAPHKLASTNKIMMENEFERLKHVYCDLL